MVEITNEERSALQDAFAQLIGRAWADESFKAELIAEPDAASAKLGVVLPEGVHVEFYDDPAASLGSWSRVIEGTDEILRVPIPARPDAGAASANELAGVGGGTSNQNNNQNQGSGGGEVDLSPDDVEGIIAALPLILSACCCGATSQDVDAWY